MLFRSPGLMEYLGDREIDSILLEGGGGLNESALRSGIVKEVKAFVAPKIFGGAQALTPVAGLGAGTPDQAWMFTLARAEQVGEDVLLTYRSRTEGR